MHSGTATVDTVVSVVMVTGIVTTFSLVVATDVDGVCNVSILNVTMVAENVQSRSILRPVMINL